MSSASGMAIREAGAPKGWWSTARIGCTTGPGDSLCTLRDEVSNDDGAGYYATFDLGRTTAAERKAEMDRLRRLLP